MLQKSICASGLLLLVRAQHLWKAAGIGMGGFAHYSAFAFLLGAAVPLSDLPPSNRDRSSIELWSVPYRLVCPGPTKVSRLTCQADCWDSWSFINLQEDSWHVGMPACSLGAFLEGILRSGSGVSLRSKMEQRCNTGAQV